MTQSELHGKINKIIKDTYTATDRKKEIATLLRPEKDTIKWGLAEAERQIEIQAKRTEIKKTEIKSSLRHRVKLRLVELSNAEIRRRGLTTPTGWSKGSISDRAGSVWVLHAGYNYHYSNKYQSRYGDPWIAGSFFCGKKNGNLFAIRIPGKITTVIEAIEYTTPAAVKKAQEKGLWTARQGDVFLVEKKSGDHNLGGLPGSHQANINQKRRTLTHRQHKAIIVPKRVKSVRAYTANALSGGAD